MTSRNHEFDNNLFESDTPAADTISTFHEVRAQDYIDMIRVETNGRLDITATSRKAGGTVTDLSGSPQHHCYQRSAP